MCDGILTKLRHLRKRPAAAKLHPETVAALIKWVLQLLAIRQAPVVVLDLCMRPVLALLAAATAVDVSALTDAVQDKVDTNHPNAAGVLLEELTGNTLG